MEEHIAVPAFRPGLPEPAPRFTGLPRYNFIMGHNDPAEVPVSGLMEALSAALTEKGALLGLYNLGHGPQGYSELREFIAEKVGRLRGIDCGEDEVLVTSGSLQGMDLVNHVLLAPGDTVILEEFTYSGAIRKAQARGAEVIGAPLDEGGLQMDRLREILEGLRAKGVTPKYIYTVPTVQNPTGSVMDLDRRRQLIALAHDYGVPIIEDECYADVIWTEDAPPPALYALAPGQVVHIGSFSKCLAPALRLGYVIANWSVLSQLIACKGDGGTGALEQLAVANYFRDNFETHRTQLASALRRKRDVMMEAVAREFGTTVETSLPKGGIFLWLTFPGDVDVREFAAAALDRGVAFNPGPEWACDPESARNRMRLCFALPTEADINEGVAELARVCFEHIGVPERGANRSRL